MNWIGRVDILAFYHILLRYVAPSGLGDHEINMVWRVLEPFCHRQARRLIWDLIVEWLHSFIVVSQGLILWTKEVTVRAGRREEK
jgi:hypothetical protein